MNVFLIEKWLKYDQNGVYFGTDVLIFWEASRKVYFFEDYIVSYIRELGIASLYIQWQGILRDILLLSRL